MKKKANDYIKRGGLCIGVGSFLFLFIFIGCISNSPVHYYTLELTPPAPSAGNPVCLQVASVRAVESLKRKEIMVRKSPVEIEYYSSHLWASSLEELFAHKLNQSFFCPQMGKTEPIFFLHVEILECEEVVTESLPQVSVKLLVHYLSPDKMDIVTQKVYSFDKEAVTNEVKDVVKALSECVDQIITEIYKDVTEWENQQK